MKNLLVSVHIPKTGGSTFSTILHQKFGSRFQRAYKDKPEIAIVEDPSCIHGHSVLEMFGDQLKDRKEASWITFLRDPLRSAISMYYYTRKRSEETTKHFEDSGLSTFLTHNKPTQWPNPPGYNHNRFTKWFERYAPLAGKFNFVGLTDAFEESMFLLYHHLGWDPIIYDTHNEGTYSKPELDKKIVERFRELNQQDYLLYEQSKQSLQQAKNAYGAKYDSDFNLFVKKIKNRCVKN